MKEFDQCDCSCAKFCPLNRAGTAIRCTLAELISYFKCQETEALERLHQWQKRGERALDFYRDER